MKIIADAGNHVVLVEATEDEVAKVAGYDWRGSQGSPRIIVGLEISISEVYNNLRSIQEAADNIRRVQQTLRAVADVLDTVPPVIEAAQTEKGGDS